MSAEANKAVIRRWVEEVINKNNQEVLHETHTANYVNHLLPPGAPQGIPGEKMLTGQFAAAFSEANYQIDDLIVEGDKAALRYTYTGKHTGTFNNIPATGKTFTASGINMLRLENGKIAENWVQFDLLGLMQQLGVIPMPAQA